MSRLSLFCILLFISFLAQSQKKIYLDVSGDTIKSKDFYNKFYSPGLSMWISESDENKELYRLVERYMIGTVSFKKIALELSRVTGKVTPPDKTILIEFYFKDDKCWSKNGDNNWSRTEINNRKSFLKDAVKSIDKDNYIFFILFENEIELNNKPEHKSEYFYSDRSNFFREMIFKVPTYCGSYAAIKPNGEVLVYNGESRIDFFLVHLQPEQWNKFFPAE